MTRQIDYAGVVLSLDPEQEERKQVRSQLLWDYGQVPALHRKAVEDAAVEILVSGRKMQQSVLVIGQRLGEVKRLLEHGQFCDWCEREFGMNVRTAQRMMSVAANLDGKSDKLSHLGTSVLYLIGADSTPEPVREAVIAQAESTGRSPSVAEVKAAIQAHKIRQLTYGALLAHIELMAGDGLDLYEADQEWLINYIEDALRRKNMSADGLDIGSAIMETRDEVAKRAAREHRLAAARAAAEAADRQALAASDLQVMQPAPALRGAEHGINGAFVRTREAATGDPRLGKMRRLVSLYEMVVNSFDEFGELTGRDIETLAAGREMRKLIGWLEREINLLEGRDVQPLEESEGWG